MELYDRIRNQNIESDWEAFIKNVEPDANDYVAQQVAPIIQSRLNGFYPVTLMTNMINKYKNGNSHDEVVTYISREEIDREFESLLHTVNPHPTYGGPLANEIAEIIEMNIMDIDVYTLQLNVISNWRSNQTASLQPIHQAIDLTDE